MTRGGPATATAGPRAPRIGGACREGRAMRSFEQALSSLFRVTDRGFLGPPIGRRIRDSRSCWAAALDGDGAAASSSAALINREPLADPSRDAYVVLSRYLDPSGRYSVSPVEPGMVSEAGALQGESFHEPMTGLLGAFDGMARASFTAEVLGSLTQKLRYNRHDQFACLVATAVGGAAGQRDGGAASPILGVVELSQQSDPTVIASARLPPTSVYAYVACMAVRSSHRRQGVSQALLSACDYLASAWGIAWLALHVDADNAAAVGAYRKAGFAEVAATGGGLFGGRRRLLMVRRVGAGEVGGEGGGRGAPLLP